MVQQQTEADHGLNALESLLSASFQRLLAMFYSHFIFWLRVLPDSADLDLSSFSAVLSMCTCLSFPCHRMRLTPRVKRDEAGKCSAEILHWANSLAIVIKLAKISEVQERLNTWELKNRKSVYSTKIMYQKSGLWKAPSSRGSTLYLPSTLALLGFPPASKQVTHCSSRPRSHTVGWGTPQSKYEPCSLCWDAHTKQRRPRYIGG